MITVDLPVYKLRRDAKAAAEAGHALAVDPLEYLALLEALIKAERQLMEEPLLYSTERAAPLISLSPETLDDWRGEGVGPKFVRLKGRGAKGKGKIAYPREELLLYASSLPRFQSTTEADLFELKRVG